MAEKIGQFNDDMETTEKERALSNADLVEHGAEYVMDKGSINSEPRLELTKEQIREKEMEMLKDLGEDASQEMKGRWKLEKEQEEILQNQTTRVLSDKKLIKERKTIREEDNSYSGSIPHGAQYVVGKDSSKPRLEVTNEQRINAKREMVWDLLEQKDMPKQKRYEAIADLFKEYDIQPGDVVQLVRTNSSGTFRSPESGWVIEFNQDQLVLKDWTRKSRKLTIPIEEIRMPELSTWSDIYNKRDQDLENEVE